MAEIKILHRFHAGKMIGYRLLELVLDFYWECLEINY